MGPSCLVAGDSRNDPLNPRRALSYGLQVHLRHFCAGPTHPVGLLELAVKEATCGRQSGGP